VPDFLLADVDKAVEELAPARELGLAAIVDAMPCSAARNVLKLAEISLRSGIHVIAPSGLHLAKYYAPDLWSETEPAPALADRFIGDIVEGIDEHDYMGPVIERTEHRAGVMKIAAGAPELTPREQRVYEATAIAHLATGCPILTHTPGPGALEQVRFLADHGVDPSHVVLSHTDKVVDRGYHREILATGAFVMFDQGFRWKPGVENGTLTLLDWLIEDGLAGQLLLGMDAARQSYWTAYGGKPGMTYLLGSFADEMRQRGIGDDVQATMFVRNPARAYTFATVESAA
jgi:phosphotriesterase-related protein